MSVQVRRRRESAAFLSTFVGAQGELLVDTTNNRVQVHDGATPGGWPAAKLTDVVQRTTAADANYTALTTDRTIAYTTITASRTVTLPAAAAYPAGAQLLVVDESGACSPLLTITLARAGADTINGAPSAAIAGAYGFLALTSNGKGAWTLVDFAGATVAQLTNRNAAINGNFAVNQRAYASTTALAAGAYAHDRWKAGSGGCTYTFTQAAPDTTITITAGSLIQAVDAPNIYAAAWWLTWTGTATARVYQGSASSQTSPAYFAGTTITVSGTPINGLLVSGLTVGAITTIEFGAGTLGLVQFEAALPNAGPTRFERRQNEVALCQRYFFSVYNNGLLTRSYNPAASASIVAHNYRLPVSMRAMPTVASITFDINDGAESSAMDFVAATSQQDLVFLKVNVPSLGWCDLHGFTASAEI